METSFKNINLETYLQENRARAERKAEISGLSFVNQRQEEVQKFVDKINSERKGTKYKPVTWSAINGQLRYFKHMSDLQRFYMECSNGNCFSSLFWWKLKKMRCPQEKV